MEDGAQVLLAVWGTDSRYELNTVQGSVLNSDPPKVLVARLGDVYLLCSSANSVPRGGLVK